MCDFGYKRNTDTGLCERDELFEKRKADICIDGQEEIESRTYKLIPGDKCDPSKMDNKGTHQFKFNKFLLIVNRKMNLRTLF